MKKLASRTLPILLLSLLAASALPAQARNTKLMFPISEVTGLPATQAAVGMDMALHFGAAWSDTLGPEPTMAGEAWARGVANPTRSGVMGRTETLTDQQTCREAFRSALLDLSRQARSRGANAVIKVVSFYDRIEMSDPFNYECHAGMTRAVVELRGRIARIEPSLVATLQGSLPGAARAKVARLEPALMPATGKDLSDTSLLPHASERMKERYQVFLTRPLPRAFAISEAGEWWMAWGRIKNDPDKPTDRALRECEKNYAKRCVLYAVDNAVVYQPPGQ